MFVNLNYFLNKRIKKLAYKSSIEKVSLKSQLEDFILKNTGLSKDDFYVLSIKNKCVFLKVKNGYISSLIKENEGKILNFIKSKNKDIFRVVYRF